MITLSERLQLELRNRDPCEVTELILDNSKANEIEGLDGSYVNLRELSLVNVGLTTLKGFPSLPNLEKLDLSDNKISTGLDNLIQCSKLSQLLLTNNRIKSIKDIECLAHFKQLEILDLFNCAVSGEESYRKEVFSLVPTLKYLDGFDEKNEEELNESEEYEDDDDDADAAADDNLKDVYELSDGSESADDEEYETEEGDIINATRTSGKAPNTGGKDMNLYPNEVVEISDEEDLDENDEYDEDEDYDNEKSLDDIIETNGKSKINNNYITESEDDDDEDDDDDNDEDDDEDDNNIKNNNTNNIEEDDDDENDDEIEDDDEDINNRNYEIIDESSLNNDTNSLINGIDKSEDEILLNNSLKRKYDRAFNDCCDEDESCDIKSLRNNSDFELTDESSLLDKV